MAIVEVESSRTTRANGLVLAGLGLDCAAVPVTRIIKIHAFGQLFAPFFRSNQPNPAACNGDGGCELAVWWQPDVRAGSS